MKTQAEIEAMSTKDILAFYNTTAAQKGTKLVTRFADRATAIKRTLTLLGTAETAETGKPEVAPPPAKPPVVATPKPPVEPEKPKEPAKDAKRGKGAQADRKQRGMRFVFPVEKEIKPVREGSKRYKLLQLLQTEDGATFEECMKHTGWERKDCYEGIRLLHYYSGYGMSHDDKTGKIKVRTK